MSKFAIAVVTFAAALSGCGSMGKGETVGTAGGAVAGGAVGSAVTGGSTVGTIGGAVLGGAAGNEAGRRYDERNRR